jgi:hypothetical protein
MRPQSGLAGGVLLFHYKKNGGRLRSTTAAKRVSLAAWPASKRPTKPYRRMSEVSHMRNRCEGMGGGSGRLMVMASAARASDAARPLPMRQPNTGRDDDIPLLAHRDRALFFGPAVAKGG